MNRKIDERAKARVRRKALQRRQQAEEESLEQALANTRGLWKSGDGLRYQRRARSEWK